MCLELFGSRTLLQDTLQAVFQTQAERSEISTGRGLATQTGIRDQMRLLPKSQSNCRTCSEVLYMTVVGWLLLKFRDQYVMKACYSERRTQADLVTPPIADKQQGLFQGSQRGWEAWFCAYSKGSVRDFSQLFLR